MRIRLAGIIFIDGGVALMHRKDVKNKPLSEYYVFPGGGQEEGETYEEGAIREIKEEFGIDVEIVRKVYEINQDEFGQKSIYFLCKYVGGKFGTGNGPEFNGDLKYADSGKFIPEIVKPEDLEKIPLMPPEIAEKFIKDIKNRHFYLIFLKKYSKIFKVD